MIELSDSSPSRVATGRVKLILIEAENTETIKAAFAKHIHEDSMIWHDGDKAFDWLEGDT